VEAREVIISVFLNWHFEVIQIMAKNRKVIENGKYISVLLEAFEFYSHLPVAEFCFKFEGQFFMQLL
jgi:hypothetical protein